MSRRLSVFIRSGCHLCDDMLLALERYGKRTSFEMEVIDILGKPELESEYGTRIPVVEGEEGEICHYFLDERALQQYFDKN